MLPTSPCLFVHIDYPLPPLQVYLGISGVFPATAECIFDGTLQFTFQRTKICGNHGSHWYIIKLPSSIVLSATQRSNIALHLARSYFGVSSLPYFDPSSFLPWLHASSTVGAVWRKGNGKSLSLYSCCQNQPPEMSAKQVNVKALGFDCSDAFQLLFSDGELRCRNAPFFLLGKQNSRISSDPKLERASDSERTNGFHWFLWKEQLETL